jgi:hypothetical protein
MEQPLPPGKYWVLGGEGPDRRRVSFRMGGERCNPDEITKLTGLQPSLAHRTGDDRVSGGRVINQYREGIWCLDSDPAISVSGTTVEEHLIYLLDQLDPSRVELTRVARERDLRVDFFCGYFMEQSNSGWDISAETLARIAALGASLGFDVYGPPEDTEDRQIETG